MRLAQIFFIFFLFFSGCANVKIGIGVGDGSEDDSSGNRPPPPPPPQQKVSRSLSVASHVNVFVPVGNIDDWFRSGTQLLDNNNCPVQFERRGGLGTFGGAIPAKIITEEQLLQVENFAIPHEVRIVETLGWCGDYGNFNGCAVVGRGPIVIIQNPDPLTLLHEYGHVKGLRHVGDRNNIMFEKAENSRREINGEQCEAYKR